MLTAVYYPVVNNEVSWSLPCQTAELAYDAAAGLSLFEPGWIVLFVRGRHVKYTCGLAEIGLTPSHWPEEVLRAARFRVNPVTYPWARRGQ